MLGVCYGSYEITCLFVDCYQNKFSAQPRAARPPHFPDRAFCLAALIFTFSAWTGYLQAQEEDVPATEPDIAHQRAVEPPVEESSAIDAAVISDEAELPVTGEQAANGIEEFIAREDAVNYYLDAIEDAEAANSAYSADLAELYQGLGNSMLEQQAFDDAKKAFQQGIQIVRVNYGLNSPTQTDYLFQIANIENIIGDHGSVDELLDTIYSINANYYGELDPGMLPVLRQLLAWFEDNRPINSEASYYPDIQRSVQLYTQMAAITELDKGIGHPETTAMYRYLGQSQWNTVKFLISQGVIEAPSVNMSSSFRSENPLERVSVQAHVRVGRDAFIKVAESVAKDPDRSVLEVAEAMAQFADWSLVSGKRNAAEKAYEEAYQLIVQISGSTELADEYFSEPVMVRFMNRQFRPVGEDPPRIFSNANPVARPLSTSQREFASQLMEPTGPATLEDNEAVVTDSQALADPMTGIAALPNEMPIITLTMMITDRGKPMKVKVVQQPPELTDKYMRKVKKQFTRIRFRPRLDNGIPVKTESFTWNISLTDTEYTQ